MGLPKVSNNTAPNCSGLPGTRPCTSADIIENVNRIPPVYLPYTSPVYSNIGFAVLGMVIEAATGKKFDDVVKSDIFDIAGMNSTSFNGPVESFPEAGFVPFGESTWNVTLGVFEALVCRRHFRTTMANLYSAGGMFSNTADLVAFCEGILKHQFLSPMKTRRWMKPVTHTSSLGFSVGAPWEILRSSNLTADKRLIDVYTKSGDLGLYHALIGIIPDYDLVISVLTGGVEVTLESQARTEIFSTVMESLLPAIDAAAREDSAEKGFVGSFSDDATNSTLRLSMDDGPGVLIKSFMVRGFDVLANFPNYNLGNMGSNSSGSGGAYVEGRLYPVDITSRCSVQGGGRGNCSAEIVWRAAFETLTEEQRALQDSKLFYIDGSCESWFGLDRAAYNYLSLAEFVFRTDSSGRVQDVRNAAFNVTLKSAN